MNTPNDPKGAAGALKTPLGLIPSYAMEQTAWVHKLGSDKYGPFNWRKTGVCASTYVNAILRHLNAWRDGETVDPESGISHLAHVACSCNILLDAGFCGTLQDDRNITPPNTPVSKMDKSMPIEREYRVLQAGELIQKGDEFFCPLANEWECTSNVGQVNKWGGVLYRRKVEPVEEPIPYTEYRLLKAGEIVQEGDEYYCEESGDWIPTWIPTKFYPTGKLESYYAVKEDGDKYRRKDERTQECSCGRIKINHFMLGLICEDCEIRWQDPY